MPKKKGGSRNYTKPTLKVLFALSGNRCAHPECNQTLVESATEDSEAVPIADICHIYASAENGPRGKSDLTQQELNSPDNLILLCPTHHRIVDRQHESYPAETLKEWKRKHESEVRQKLSADMESVPVELFSHPYFPIELVDQKTAEDVERLRKCRMFVEFDEAGFAQSLGERVANREYSGGNDQARSQALAWCARILAGHEKVDEAERFLNLARQLSANSETIIALAYVHSRREGCAAGLRALSELDSPASRTAAFTIVNHHDGAERAISWLGEAGIPVSDLDSDGKTIVLANQLALGNWRAGLETLEAVSSEDLQETPALCHVAAMTELLTVVPDELRMMVSNQVPMDISRFPLVANPKAMTVRRKLIEGFRNAAQIASQLQLPKAVRANEDYALWLELLDPDLRSQARLKVENRLRDPDSALSVVHIAVQLGIELDVGKVERNIEREIARTGGTTLDAAYARLGLVSVRDTPEEMAKYLALHQAELSSCIEKNSLLVPQIELLAHAKNPEKALLALDELIEIGIPREQESYLRRMIEDSQGGDFAAALKEQFETSGSVRDLMNLVDWLEAGQQWSQVCVYGRQLFDLAGRLEDAERLAFALSRVQKFETLVEFLGGNLHLLSRSKDLRVHYAWGLYQEGMLLEAREQLSKLDDGSEDPSCRALKANLAIVMGDGVALTSFLEREYQNRNQRTAKELIEAAHLAVQIGFRHLKKLLFLAAEKGDHEPNVLVAAYSLACNAGLEGDPQVAQWIRKAAELSDGKGPVQRIGPKEILEMKPEWDRLESDTWHCLLQGEIPIFLAAEHLNRTLTDLTIRPALANLSEGDPRRRSVVPAFAGNRGPQRLTTRDTTVAIDATALLTLSFLEILDESLDAFDTVYLSHSTLGWLFQEQHRVTHHQPSLVEKAHRIRDLLAIGALERFVLSSAPDDELARQVGEELAGLITEAHQRSDEDSQHIVVRSSPVYRVTSLMEEQADLTVHEPVLCGCLAIVEKLKQKGQITIEEESQARAYLQLKGSPWPRQPVVSDGATLYLDGLAVTYFQHIGLLDKLRGAGLRAVVSPRVVSEGDSLISFENTSEKAKRVIEHLQIALNSRIESGRIKVGRKQRSNEDEDEASLDHPSVGLFSVASHCDAAIVDDRFINQHQFINEGGGQVPIFSTLDLLNALVHSDLISMDERANHLTKLRRAGFVCVPIEVDELILHLNASEVDRGEVVETAELKAVRESLLRIRMGDWLQIPKEVPWLSATLQACANSLKGLWRDGADVSEARARSNWIVDQIDSRGWAHRVDAENGEDLIRTGPRLDILRLLGPPLNVSSETVDAYWKWVEEKVLSPLKTQSPEFFDQLVEHYEQKIREISQVELSEVDGS